MMNDLLLIHGAGSNDLTFDALRTDSTWSQMDASISKLGFHCWTYSAAPIGYSLSRAPVRVTTYPRDHVAACVERQLYSSCPALPFSTQHKQPASFRAVRNSTPPSRKLRSILELNDQFAVTRGIVIPLFNFYGAIGTLAICFDGNDVQLDDVWSRHGAQMTEHAKQINDRILRRYPQCFSRGLLPELTARQREIVRLLARGLSTAELSESLQVSIDTINKHTAAIKRRFGTRTTAQTTALAAQWGML